MGRVGGGRNGADAVNGAEGNPRTRQSQSLHDKDVNNEEMRRKDEEEGVRIVMGREEVRLSSV